MILFKKKIYASRNISSQTNIVENEPIIPDGLWIKCLKCKKTVYIKQLSEHKICPNCGAGFRLNIKERLAITADEDSFVEFDASMTSGNPLSYPSYEKKIEVTSEVTGLNEAVVCGYAEIMTQKCILCIMDSNFIMGSMGSVVGEKITRAFEKAYEENLPVIIFTASGGARMQEGIISLMQMAKVSAAVKKHSDKGLLYITVLTDPTTGGVTASFAMLGDIILSEPGALVGFAGRRVIEQTIKQTLPDDFQTAEFLLEHGFIDKIAERKQMRNIIASILSLHARCEQC